MRLLHTTLVSRRSTARVRKVQQIIILSRKSKPSDRGLDILISQRAVAVVDNVLCKAAPLEMKNRGLKMDAIHCHLINSRIRGKQCKGLSLNNNHTQALCRVCVVIDLLCRRS